MTTAGGFLVVGGDSLVGGELLRALERRGHAAVATTRRAETAIGGRIFLDFESNRLPGLPADAEYAYLVAAATNYERCERDPLAHRINVELIPQLVTILLERDIFVSFISTNSVFGGERPWPTETDPHAPGIAYARQKSAAEAAIQSAAGRLGAEDRLNIVRLTKVLGHGTPPLPDWLAAWGQERAVQPFGDLVFAPISTRFAGEALATIGEARVPGQLHVSGAENITYVQFAQSLAESLGIDARCVSPTTADKQGVSVPFKPRYSGLDMRRTTELTGVAPQPLADLVKDLTAEVSVDPRGANDG